MPLKSGLTQMITMGKSIHQIWVNSHITTLDTTIVLLRFPESDYVQVGVSVRWGGGGGGAV